MGTRYYYSQNFYGCYGNVQDLDIRTQLAQRISKIYNMSILRGKKFVRPNVGVTYTTTAKIFMVAMETSKTQIFELSSLRGIQKYIICLCYEKKFC